MSERVAADPRVCGLNPTKDPMVPASISQKKHVAINNHRVSGYYQPGSRGGFSPSNGIHSFENLLLSLSLRLRVIPHKLPDRRMRTIQRHWRSTSHSWNSIVDKINSMPRVDNLLMHHHKTEIKWCHLVDNLSARNSTTLQPNSTTSSKFYNLHCKLQRQSTHVPVKSSTRAQARQVPQ